MGGNQKFKVKTKSERSPESSFRVARIHPLTPGLLTRLDQQLSDSIMMKAIRVHAHGGPEVLQLEEVPIPAIASDEVLIRVHAAGVNFLDVYQRTGLYKVALPFTPGMEGAGVVEKAGAETALKPGDRVAWTQYPGGFAEYAAVLAKRRTKEASMFFGPWECWCFSDSRAARSHRSIHLC